MIYIPYYGALTLPDVSCYFKLDALKEMADKPIEVGDKVLFLMLKESKKTRYLRVEDIYPIATRGVVESIEGEWALLHTTSRVNLDSIQADGKSFHVEMRTRPEINDLDPEEQNKRFQKMRSDMLEALEGTQWLMGARNYVMRWNNMNELVSLTSAMLQISSDEKYAILRRIPLQNVRSGWKRLFTSRWSCTRSTVRRRMHRNSPMNSCTVSRRSADR